MTQAEILLKQDVKEIMHMNVTFSLSKILFTGFSGALGLMVLNTSAAQAGQARVTGAALVDDGSQVSAVAGETILAPGQLIDGSSAVEIDPTITPLTDSSGNNLGDAVTDLEIDFGINNDANVILEYAIADQLFDTDGSPVFEKESDIISLVENFGGVNSPLGQAEVTGAAAFDTDNTVSAVAGQAELARGQVLGDEAGEPIAQITPTLANNNEVLEQLDLGFEVSNNEFNLLEEAIAETVDNASFNRNSDIVSLVKAFTEDSEQAVNSEQVLGLD